MPKTQKNKMNQQPLVSIIIPTYNREKYIKKAIDSALNQTYKNIEIIIVDGSPNDETEKVIKPYLIDPRIHYVHQEEVHLDYGKDRNASGARNEGIKISKGKYIAVLDDDDWWCDQRKLEKQVQFLESYPDYVACGGGVIVIYEKSKKLFYQRLFSERDEDVRKEMLLKDIFVHSSLVFRKDTWELMGGYDEQLPYGDDWDFYLRLGKIGKLYNFQEYFTYFLIGQQNKINRIKYGRKNLRNNILFIKKYRNDYPGFSKAILLAWLHYLYSFLPFGGSLRPILAKIKHKIFDRFLYK